MTSQFDDLQFHLRHPIYSLQTWVITKYDICIVVVCLNKWLCNKFKDELLKLYQCLSGIKTSMHTVDPSGKDPTLKNFLSVHLKTSENMTLWYKVHPIICKHRHVPYPDTDLGSQILALWNVEVQIRGYKYMHILS